MKIIKFKTLAFSALISSGWMSAQGQMAIDETNFPDANFRTYVSSNFDTDGDGALSDLELFSVNKIECNYSGITSLEGIQHFVLLKQLYCESNSLTSLDVSQNRQLVILNCRWNNITTLDVSNNTQLSTLYCGYNSITSLDVSMLTNLLQLGCNNNNLTSIDVSNNKKLTYLACASNDIGTLDVSVNTALTQLQCGSCNLDVLDVSNNTALTILNCDKNNLESLDVSKNTALQTLWCDVNKLSALDVSKNTKLTELQCGVNRLTSLDLSQNTLLDALYCGENLFTSIDLSKNTLLGFLDCSYNYIESLDLSKNTQLWYLHCGGNSLTDLDLTKNTKLSSVTLTRQDPVVKIAVGGSTRNKLGVPFPQIESSRLISLRNQNETVSSPEYITIDGERNLVLKTSNADVHFTDASLSVVRYEVKPKYASSVSNSVKNRNMLVFMHYLPFHALYLNPLSIDNNRDGVYTGTLYLDVPTAIPTDCDLKAYSAKDITKASEDEGRLVLQEQSGILPTGSGIVVTAAESGLHVFTGDAEYSVSKGAQLVNTSTTYRTSPEAYYPNVLAGTYAPEGLTVSYREVLTLGPRRDDNSGTVGFWNYTGTKLNQFRCYIPSDKIPSAMLSPKFQGLSFLIDDEAGTLTAVESVPADYGPAAGGVYYDLQGRRVRKPQRGGIYIVNGKKVMM